MNSKIFLVGTLMTNRLIKLCYVISMTFLSPSDEEPGRQLYLQANRTKHTKVKDGVMWC